MTWNIYDIGTISLGLALGMIAASEMVISKKLILQMRWYETWN